MKNDEKIRAKNPGYQMVQTRHGERRVVKGREISPWAYGVLACEVVKERVPRSKRLKTRQSST